MLPEDICLLAKQQPFKPFAIVMVNGERFEIHHPELLMVGRSILAVGISRTEGIEVIADHIVWLAVDQVLKIEPLETMLSA